MEIIEDIKMEMGDISIVTFFIMILVIAVILIINKNIDKYNLNKSLKWDFLEAFFASFVFGIFGLLYILLKYWNLVFDPQNYCD
jgi:hypothetical protein